MAYTLVSKEILEYLFDLPETVHITDIHLDLSNESRVIIHIEGEVEGVSLEDKEYVLTYQKTDLGDQLIGIEGVAEFLDSPETKDPVQ